MKNRVVFVCFLLVICTASASFLCAHDASEVQVYTENSEDGRIDFYADNALLVPVYLVIDFTQIRNLTADIDLPFARSIEAESSEIYLFSLSQMPGVSASYRYSVRYSIGDPENTQHDNDFLYTFPFAHGSKHKITQGFNGMFTHMGDNQFAVDFDLAEGDPVHAARSGVVAEIKEDSNRGGNSPQFAQDGNFIRILHSDGTFGNYVHLQQEGVLVNVGDEVQAGQEIGISGSTGYGSGPHLHFDVRVPTREGRTQSIPIRFKGINGESVDPEEGRFYYSYHDGGEPFETSFGADLTNADFANYQGTASKADSIELRNETVDDSEILYISNGFDYAINAQVNIQLISMTSTVDFPQSIRLEAGEERFLGIVRPVPGVARSSYRSNIRYSRAR